MAEQHTFTTAGKNAGVFCQKSGYRVNAYDVISTCGKKTIYTKPASIRNELIRCGTQPKPKTVPAGSLEHAARYFFSYQPNFQVGEAPYTNQAHHMIPDQTFLDLFDKEEREILRQVEYDINNGHNFIFLPANSDDCAFHNLPQHSGRHDNYSREVKKRAKDLSQKLQKYINNKQCEKEDEIPKDIVDQLMKLQDQLWNFLKNAGPVPVSSLRPKLTKKKLSR